VSIVNQSQGYLFLKFDLLEVSAGRRLGSLRQTRELEGVAALQIGAGRGRSKRVELVKVSVHGEDLAALGTHVVPLVLQNLTTMGEMSLGQ